MQVTTQLANTTHNVYGKYIMTSGITLAHTQGHLTVCKGVLAHGRVEQMPALSQVVVVHAF